MISGAHVSFYSENSKLDRDFFQNVLKVPLIDCGDGFLVFGLPPTTFGFRNDAKAKDDDDNNDNNDNNNEEGGAHVEEEKKEAEAEQEVEEDQPDPTSVVALAIDPSATSVTDSAPTNSSLPNNADKMDVDAKANADAALSTTSGGSLKTEFAFQVTDIDAFINEMTTMTTKEEQDDDNKINHPSSPQKQAAVFVGDVDKTQSWGHTIRIRLPSGATMLVYQSVHKGTVQKDKGEDKEDKGEGEESAKSPGGSPSPSAAPATASPPSSPSKRTIDTNDDDGNDKDDKAGKETDNGKNADADLSPSSKRLRVTAGDVPAKN